MADESYNRFVEYDDGVIEVLPMPTKQHQAISRYLFLALYALMRALVARFFMRLCDYRLDHAAIVSLISCCYVRLAIHAR